MSTWLEGAHKHDLSATRGNGPFETFQGLILHVNVSEDGTPVSLFEAGPPSNPDYVTPNVQIYKDGRTAEFLPLDDQPWCQIEGNYHWAAAETAGLPGEPLTDAQVAVLVKLVQAYETRYNVRLSVTDDPNGTGFGTHQMGGAAWGGHACPGTVRAAQRHRILRLAHSQGGSVTTPDPNAELVASITEAVGKVLHESLHHGVKVRLLKGDDGQFHEIETFLSGVRGYRHLAGRKAKKRS